MTLRPRYLRERRATRKPDPPPPSAAPRTEVAVECELPGMEGVERVPLPFYRQPPKYRVEYTSEVRGYLTFTSDEDPETWLEYDDNVDPLIRDFWDFQEYDVEPGDMDGPIQQLREDGTWGPVDRSRFD